MSFDITRDNFRTLFVRTRILTYYCLVIFTFLVRENRSSDIFQNPRHELGNSRAHTRQIGLRAPNAPGYDSGEEVSAVLTADLERTSGVTLNN